MTVIEFFDKDSAIKNVVSTLLCKPEKVVFIGNGSKKMRRSIEKYRELALSRGLTVDFEIKSVQTNNLMAVVGAIEDAASENPDCVIDLSGGEDLCLVAVGIVYGENADSIRLHRFNISDNRMTDCDSDGVLCASMPMELSVEENISVYGGRVVYSDEKSGGTQRWDFSGEMVDDIFVMWSECKKNPTLWNSQIKILGRICSEKYLPEELSFSADRQELKEATGDKAWLLGNLNEMLKRLNSLGVISNLRLNDSKLSFDFKNRQIKNCLTKEGLILELTVAVAAGEAQDENGELIYNDVATGVYIDWDGEIQPEYKADVENEIDVILMKGMVPVFISCKNGMVSIDELYKLSVVAERFGGRFVRKVLVATELEKLGSKEGYIRARAESMGIRIIDDADIISEDALIKKIKNLWK
ncbi:MAG: DUF1887 family protein [Clostridia bacterium]|nr:DUF1887 family protein [Clostridia bacterium]